MPRAAFADVMREWEKLIVGVLANLPDLQGLETYRAQLEAEITGAKEANTRQATFNAQAQQATRDLEGFLTRGNDLAVRLRSGIRSRYGNRSEKLTEFGLQPFRKSKKKEKPEGEEKAAPSKAPQDGNP